MSKRNGIVDKVLIRDIVIPAGTVFRASPTKTERASNMYGTAFFGLTDDTSGSIEYPILGDDDELLKEWFVDLK
jgi:hypothetical protein